MRLAHVERGGREWVVVDAWGPVFGGREIKVRGRVCGSCVRACGGVMGGDGCGVAIVGCEEEVEVGVGPLGVVRQEFEEVEDTSHAG